MGCVVGIAFNFSGLNLWEGINHFIKQLAICSLPLGLMCVGAALQFMALKKDLLPPYREYFLKINHHAFIGLLCV